MNVDKATLIILKDQVQSVFETLERLLEDIPPTPAFGRPYLIREMGKQAIGKCAHWLRHYYCPFPAVTERGYCLNHDPERIAERAKQRELYLCLGMTKNGHPCKEVRLEGSNYCRHHQKEPTP